MVDSSLPVFPHDAVFADVEGIPVCLIPGTSVTAWDVPAGRPFRHSSFSHNGRAISESEFRDLVREVLQASR